MWVPVLMKLGPCGAMYYAVLVEGLELEHLTAFLSLCQGPPGPHSLTSKDHVAANGAQRGNN